MELGTPGRRVDFVGVDVLGERFIDGLVEADEQLCKSLVRTAGQHGQAVVSIGGHGDAANRNYHPDGDFAIGNQVRDVGKVLRNDWGVGGVA
jgi:hypothetical protein